MNCLIKVKKNFDFRVNFSEHRNRKTLLAIFSLLIKPLGQISSAIMIQLFNFETKTNTSSTFTRLLLQTIRLFHLIDECWLLSNSFRIAIWICHHNMNVIKPQSVSNPSYLSKERALEKRSSVIAPKILLPHGENHQPMGKITGVTPAVAGYHCLWLQASWQKFFHGLSCYNASHL